MELVSLNTSIVPGHWLVSMRRPLVTCDPQDLPLPLDVPSFVVWAQGDGAWPAQHARRGNAQVELGGAGPVSAPPPSSTELAASRSVQITMPAYRIKPGVTQYVCSNFQLPTDKKYHIIQYQVSGRCVRGLTQGLGACLGHMRACCGPALLMCGPGLVCCGPAPGCPWPALAAAASHRYRGHDARGYSRSTTLCSSRGVLIQMHAVAAGISCRGKGGCSCMQWCNDEPHAGVISLM